MDELLARGIKIEKTLKQLHLADLEINYKHIWDNSCVTIKGKLHSKECRLLALSRISIDSLYLIQDSLDGTTPSDLSETEFIFGWQFKVKSTKSKFSIDYLSSRTTVKASIILGGEKIPLEDFINKLTVTLYDLT